MITQLNRTQGIISVLFIIVIFMLGYIAYISTFPSFLSGDQNSDLVQDASEVGELESTEVTSSTGFYRNHVYGFVFLYPEISYTRIIENRYAEFGDQIGIDVPYHDIRVSLDGLVRIQVWDDSQLRKLQEKSSTPVQTVSGFQPDELEQIIGLEKEYLFRSGTHILHIFVDATRARPDELIATFLKSFRIEPTTAAIDHAHWQLWSGEDFSLQYPLDWTLEVGDVDSRGTEYALFELIRTESAEKSEYEFSEVQKPSARVRFNFQQQSAHSWLEEKLRDGRSDYIKYEKRTTLGNGILTEYELCNDSPQFVKGASVPRGSLCKSYLLLAKNPDSDRMIEFSTVFSPATQVYELEVAKSLQW